MSVPAPPSRSALKQPYLPSPITILRYAFAPAASIKRRFIAKWAGRRYSSWQSKPTLLQFRRLFPKIQACLLTSNTQFYSIYYLLWHALPHDTIFHVLQFQLTLRLPTSTSAMLWQQTVVDNSLFSQPYAIHKDCCKQLAWHTSSTASRKVH